MKTITTVLFAIAFTFLGSTQETGYWSNNRIMKSGFFVDGNIGVTSMNYSFMDYTSTMTSTGEYISGTQRVNYTSYGAGVGIVAGGKVYFGNDDQRRFGLNMFGRFNMHMIDGDFLDMGPLMAPINLGFTSIWKLSETKAVEANLNFGYGIDMGGPIGGGLLINPELKFRFKKSSFGLGYTYQKHSNSNGSGNVNHALNLIIGIN